MSFERLRSAAPPVRELLVSINPNARDLVGHHINFDASLRRELNRDGDPLISLIGLDAERELDRDYGWVVPTFSSRFLETHAGHPDVAALLPTLPPELGAGLDIATRAAAPERTRAFWYMGNLEYLEIDGLFDDRDISHHLHLFFAYVYDVSRRAGRDHVTRLLGRVEELPHVELSLATTDIRDAWADALGVELAVLPSAPSMIFADDDRPEVAAVQRHRVLFPGTGSKGKGFDDTLRHLRAHLDAASGPPPDITIRHVGSSTRATRRTLTRAGKTDGIEVLTGTVSSTVLRARYLDAAAVVLPYRPDPFRFRSSAAFTDAVFAGAPLVACAGTHMGRLIEVHGLGTTYSAGDTEGLASAIEETHRRREEFCEQVSAFRPTWSEQSSWAAVAAAIRS